MKTTAWFAISHGSETILTCCACGGVIDLQFPSADHHPRSCPRCGVECVFLNWKGRTLQVVPGRAPTPLAQVIRWAQVHLDELEYVELICALEEIADTLAGIPQSDGSQPGKVAASA